MPTPDDLAGGITDADKIILNNEGETADNPGEIVWDGTQFVFRDNDGTYDPKFGTGLSEGQHETLDTLAHDLVEDSYDEYVYAGNRVTQLIVWDSPAKNTKVREELYTYTGSRLTQTVYIQYDATGTEIYRITEVITYAGNKVDDVTRTRTP